MKTNHPDINQLLEATHLGDTLKQVTHPDKIQRVMLDAYPDCGLYLHSQPAFRSLKQQVFDTPPPKLEVTEY